MRFALIMLAAVVLCCGGAFCLGGVNALGFALVSCGILVFATAPMISDYMKEK